LELNNQDLYCQVLGSIMREPILLHNVPSKITLDDFHNENKVCRAIFFAVNGIANEEVRNIDCNMIMTYLEQYPSIKKSFGSNGPSVVENCLERGHPESFQIYYNQLKKTSLLRDLLNHGYNVEPYDFTSCQAGSRKEFETIQRFEEATEADILGYVEKQFTDLQARHTVASVSQEYMGDGIDELIASLGEFSDQGAELQGHMFNSIVRGARLGTMYIRSAGTGIGKSRSSVFDACGLIFPIIFDTKKNSFVYMKDVVPQKVLYIMTEQVPREIRTMILAYVSGIEENRIVSNILTPAERQRLMIAAEIIKYYSKYLIFEEINDPNLNNVQATIKKHVLLDDVHYVFYDYIFSSPSLINQFSHAGIREDVALMLLANQLKEIAKTYNVFIMTSTQLNGDGLATDGKRRDQRMIRGSKAVVDKADIGCIIARVEPTDLEQVSESANRCGKAPTHVTDIYKIRSGRFKGTRIWSYYNLGNGRREDLFITDDNNHEITFESYELIYPNSNFSEEWSLEKVKAYLERKDEF